MCLRDACNPLGAGFLILNTTKVGDQIKLFLQDLLGGLQDVELSSHLLDYTYVSVSAVQQTKVPADSSHMEDRQVEGPCFNN